MVDAAFEVVVFNGDISCFYFVFERAKAVGDSNPEEAAIRGIAAVAPTHDVALGGAGFVVLVLVEWRVGSEAHGESVIAQE